MFAVFHAQQGAQCTLNMRLQVCCFEDGACGCGFCECEGVTRRVLCGCLAKACACSLAGLFRGTHEIRVTRCKSSPQTIVWSNFHVDSGMFWQRAVLLHPQLCLCRTSGNSGRLSCGIEVILRAARHAGGLVWPLLSLLSSLDECGLLQCDE